MRMRTIKPGFFENDELAALPFQTRLLFAGLWLFCDREGRCEDRPKRIKAAIFPYDQVDVPAMLDELSAADFIKKYEVGGLQLIQVTNFSEHQRPHKNEQESALPGPIGDGTTKAVPEHSQGSDMDAQETVVRTGNRHSANGAESVGKRKPESYTPKHTETPELLDHFDVSLPGICASCKTPRRTEAQLRATDRLVDSVGADAVGTLIDFFKASYRPDDDFDWREHITSLVYVERKWSKLDGVRRRQLVHANSNGHHGVAL